jgi:predicted aspartyl protease
VNSCSDHQPSEAKLHCIQTTFVSNRLSRILMAAETGCDIFHNLDIFYCHNLYFLTIVGWENRTESPASAIARKNEFAFPLFRLYIDTMNRSRKLMRKKAFLGWLSIFATLAYLFPQAPTLADKLKSGRLAADIGTQRIPFLLSGHKIFLRIRINESRELNFVLDTGAVTAVDRKIAGDLGLEEGAALPSITKSGKASISRRPVTFRWGGIKVEDFIPVISDLPSKGEGDPDLEGFIGADLLRFFCVSLDYDAGEIIFSTTTPKLDASHYHLPMRKQIPMGFPLIDAQINGERKISMMIDTGSPFPVVCPLNLIEKEKIFAEASVEKSRGIFITWPGTTADYNYRARAKTLRIGDLNIPGMTLYFAELPGPFSLSLLGYGFLKHFVTIMDFPRGELTWVLKTSGFLESTESSGMAAHKQDGRLIVRGIWPGSAADRCGIQVGDEIVRINGRNASTLSTREIDSFLSGDLSNGLEVELAAGAGVKKIILRNTSSGLLRSRPS